VTEAALEAVPIPTREAGNGADKAKNGPVEEVEAAEIAAVAPAFVAVAVVVAAAAVVADAGAAAESE
jgi:hypothetical protein